MKLSHHAEYWALRGAVGALSVLPWRRASAAGGWLGTLGYRPLGIRRAVVEQQIAASFPDFGPRDVRRMALGAYAHLGRISVEATLLPRLGAAGVLALADETHGWEEFMGALSAGRGALLVGGHLGNWEYAAAYMVARGARMEAIVRHMSNPRVEEYLNTARGRSGIGVVPDERAVRQTPRSIAGGVSVAFLADQGVAGLASTFVPFFGRMAKTPRGAAVFALRLQAPLFFFVAIRKPTGRYLFAVERVAVTPTGDRERDVDAIVVAYTRRLEQWVRRYPDQYFWHHRRWKHAPPETQRAATADAATAPHLGNDDAAAAHATRPSHGVT